MNWSELYDNSQEPTEKQINEFVESSLWEDLDTYLQQTYNIKPTLFYSNCSMDKGYWKGWNIKYKKSGKALCTLYPKQGYILLLLPIGIRQMGEAELLMPTCTEYTQNLFKESPVGRTGKSLAFEISDGDVLFDIKRLIDIRVNTK